MAKVLPRRSHVAPLRGDALHLLEHLHGPAIEGVHESGHDLSLTIEAVPFQGESPPVRLVVVARDPGPRQFDFAALDGSCESPGFRACRTRAIHPCRAAKGAEFSHSIAHHSRYTTSI